MIELIHNFFSFIIIISTIVFIHEFGHYYIARIAGVKIEIFSIGFGKELFGWYDKNSTRWKICLFPFGGYVKMFGDQNAASSPDFKKISKLTHDEKKLSFYTKKLPWKFAIISAGPIANFILGIAIMTFFFSYYGTSKALPIINSVEKSSAADKAGLRAEDEILKIDDIQIEEFSDIQRIISLNQGEGLDLKILRKGEIYDVNVIPDITEKKDMLGNLIKTRKLGIVSSQIEIIKLSPYDSFIKAFKDTYNISSSTLKAIKQIILGQRSTEELGGPIKIAQFSGHSTKQGIASVLWLIAVLSINLGLMNLLPIPMLDGGHLLFYLIEAIKGSPISEKNQQIGFQMGLFLLIIIF